MTRAELTGGPAASQGAVPKGRSLLGGCELLDPGPDASFPCPPEIVAIWDAVSNYILEQMLLDKGVLVAGFGTFCTVREELRLGPEDVLMVRRPVFQLAMYPVWPLWLKRAKVTLPDDIEIEPLNYRHLSLATSLPRAVVEDCVDETIQLFSSYLQYKENVSFVFKDIGVLARQGDKVRLKFYASCLQRLESTASLIAALRSRPWATEPVVPSPQTANPWIPPRPVYIFPRFQLVVEGSPEAKAAPAGSLWGKKAAEELRSARPSKEQRPGKLLQHREELCLPVLPSSGAGRRRQGPEKQPAARTFINILGHLTATSLEQEAHVEHLPHPPAGPRTGPASAAPRAAAQETASPRTQRLPRAARLSLFQEKQRQEQAALEELQARVERSVRHQERLRILTKQLHLDQRCSADTGRPLKKELSPRAKQNVQLTASYRVLRDSWKEKVEQNRQRLEQEEEHQRALAMCSLRNKEQRDHKLGAYKGNRSAFSPQK
ncbi:coiled-coil domain-containing protein 81-like [Dromaius novaehollandiae]|uniref:coiled-coil domain-containing protein 81-like n=1 Tax=Dromaius novaehollandiae TaxID=8790 RepID=UPI00311E94DD